MGHVDHFIGGTGVSIVDVCVSFSDSTDGELAPADLLEAAWALHTNPQALETSRMVDYIGPMVHVVQALMVKASTGTIAMERMRTEMAHQAEGG